MSSYRLLAATLSLLVAACGQDATPVPQAEPTVPSQAAAPAEDWSSLDALVGKLPIDSGLLETSVIEPALKDLLGEKIEVLKTNMQTQSPLQRDGVLYTSGNKAHDGGVNQAYLLVDPATHALEVGLWENRVLTVYKTPGSAISKPKDIQVMLDNAAL